VLSAVCAPLGLDLFLSPTHPYGVAFARLRVD
jgi:hypothetical protein